MAVLTVNSGSSSLKLALYEDDGTTCLLDGAANSIGSDQGSLTVTGHGGEQSHEETARLKDQHQAFDLLYEAMQARHPVPVDKVGHRIVHGGPRLVQHQRIRADVLKQLQDAVHFAPLHIPAAVDLVRHTQKALPGAAQFACFDTAFHQTMPPEAFTYALPRRYRDAGVRRYGFHGLSYESVVHILGANLPKRTVVAHLGSGASACAMLDGKSQDTSMGLSPTGGFLMATRPGDLDPGVVLLLQRNFTKDLPALQPDEAESLLNHECGLKGLAEETDVRHLLERTDADATLAIDLFCREIAKTIAGYLVVLDGLDMLVFTGGIGEHSAAVRQGVCDRLACFGIGLDAKANQAHSPGLISEDGSSVRVRVVPADENGQIARHVAQLSRT